MYCGQLGNVRGRAFTKGHSYFDHILYVLFVLEEFVFSGSHSMFGLWQATLGLDCKGKERTVVKCKVGDNPELLLCSLIPGVSESCALDLLFDQEVTFTVSGATSVHLTGYYMPLEEPYSSEEDDDEYDSYPLKNLS